MCLCTLAQQYLAVEGYEIITFLLFVVSKIYKTIKQIKNITNKQLDLEALEKYDVRVGVHILQNNDQAHDVNEGEQLVGSCYCSVLLGAASEQGEKSCWIAVSNSHTYFMLDVNYFPEKGKSAKEPFLLISCHQNKDLKKVEVGYGMQYTRLVYGGDTGQTYLLLPRCGKSTLHLLRMLTASKTASVDGKITICSSPFTARPLVQGQSAVVGYFLVFMRQEQLVTQKRSMKDISSMAFPQDVYPLRELSHQMLPVSIIITKEVCFFICCFFLFVRNRKQAYKVRVLTLRCHNSLSLVKHVFEMEKIILIFSFYDNCVLRKKKKKKGNLSSE